MTNDEKKTLLQQRYAELDDESLCALERHKLTEQARELFDAELARRGLDLAAYEARHGDSLYRSRTALRQRQWRGVGLKAILAGVIFAGAALVRQQYGDSLDGTLARVRHTQRPLYGFFIDHTLDAITICIMCIGFGLSPAFRLDVTLLVLAGYLVLSIYTYICTILKDEFRLTYSSFGPTEFRLVVIILNTIYMYVPGSSNRYMVWGCDFGVFDFIGLAIAAFLFIIHLCQFAKDRKTLSMRDPLKPYHPEDKE